MLVLQVMVSGTRVAAGPVLAAMCDDEQPSGPEPRAN